MPKSYGLNIRVRHCTFCSVSERFGDESSSRTPPEHTPFLDLTTPSHCFQNLLFMMDEAKICYLAMHKLFDTLQVCISHFQATQGTILDGFSAHQVLRLQST